MDITLEDYERLNPVAEVRHRGQVLRYATPNRATFWRVQTLFEKEPDTIAWLDGFDEGATLVDIGANVGMYTVYAGVVRKARVFAFEPESQNFALLNRNIALNDLAERVTAYPLALADRHGPGQLHLSRFEAGGSCHNFGEARDFRGQPMRPAFVQGSFSLRLDEMVASGAIPPPEHVKIDVDGIEDQVIAGMEGLLANPRLRSVLVEINTHLENHRAIVERMADFGFRYDPAQVEAARRTSGPFEGVGNYVFFR